jgi:putative Ca2+/H+ antiporter (TMEM165/GDT1 family)
MDTMVIIGIGNLLLLMVIFTFILMHLRDLGDKTQLSLNGISHVWGMLAELKEEEE